MIGRRWTAALAAAGLALLVTEIAVADVKEPPFRVEASDGDFEIRRYEPMIVAEVTRSGSRRAAANDGFRPLAGYIFGGNAPARKIAMTAPVIQRRAAGETIAMTAPVIEAPAAGGAWIVRFVMPAEYTMATLPRPNRPDVRLVEVPPQRMAVVRFSGVPTDRRLADKTHELEGYLARKGIAPAGDPTYAFYNPPWTLPFLRRNEVMIPLAARGGEPRSP